MSESTQKSEVIVDKTDMKFVNLTKFERKSTNCGKFKIRKGKDKKHKRTHVIDNSSFKIVNNDDNIHKSSKNGFFGIPNQLNINYISNIHTTITRNLKSEARLSNENHNSNIVHDEGRFRKKIEDEETDVLKENALTIETIKPEKKVVKPFPVCFGIPVEKKQNRESKGEELMNNKNSTTNSQDSFVKNACFRKNELNLLFNTSKNNSCPINNFGIDLMQNKRECNQMQALLSGDWTQEENLAKLNKLNNTNQHIKTESLDKDSERGCCIVKENHQHNFSGSKLLGQRCAEGDYIVKSNQIYNDQAKKMKNNENIQNYYMIRENKFKGRPTGKIIYTLNRHPLQSHERLIEFRGIVSETKGESAEEENREMNDCIEKNKLSFKDEEIKKEIGEKLESDCRTNKFNKSKFSFENHVRKPARIPSRIQRLCRRRQNNEHIPPIQINCNNISKECIGRNSNLKLKTIEKIEEDISIIRNKDLEIKQDEPVLSAYDYRNTKIETNPPIDQSPIVKVKDAVLQYEKINRNKQQKVKRVLELKKFSPQGIVNSIGRPEEKNFQLTNVQSAPNLENTLETLVDTNQCQLSRETIYLNTSKVISFNGDEKIISNKAFNRVLSITARCPNTV
ncbi:DgyrCDS551 [Dimorphilus gyrociliatus]|uniref:DgyrCDS551 n=1 Tax=Dimorphilus gyrociliatus TaxID=2664684 RepID=A0A7I8V7Q8_9ANNE|nr:DgyrCDS551 [Dimorphilus gyrociliatus]